MMFLAVPAATQKGLHLELLADPQPALAVRAGFVRQYHVGMPASPLRLSDNDGVYNFRTQLNQMSTIVQNTL